MTICVCGHSYDEHSGGGACMALRSTNHGYDDTLFCLCHEYDEGPPF